MMNDNSSLIVVDDVKKYYNDGEIKALDGVSTDIRKGEVVVIIGPSGSGKSTLLRTLNLLEHPTDGKIIFDGVNLMDKNVNINLHRQKMGMVFQHFNLFPHMTVLKNMTIAPMKLLKKSKEEAEKKAMELLDAVKESIINAYVRKTGQSRAKLSHLMDAETWMDANKAVELGFADDILFQKEEQGSEGENGDPGAGRTENGTSDSVMFSRRAVNNALMNKLERHYGKNGKSVKDQTAITRMAADGNGVSGQCYGNSSGMQETGMSGSAGAEGDDPCNGCFGAAENACQRCEKKKVNTNVTGRSADDLRERLNFIKKYI